MARVGGSLSAELADIRLCVHRFAEMPFFVVTLPQVEQTLARDLEPVAMNAPFSWCFRSTKAGGRHLPKVVILDGNVRRDLV